MKSEDRTESLKKNLKRGAAVAGVAGAGYMAARVKTVRDGLSVPRPPYDWKPDRGGSVFLKGADLIDVKRGQVQKQRGIVFRDGQITDIVSTRDLDKVEADQTFDCTGLFAMPGLINCHVHSLLPGAGLPSLELALSYKRQITRGLEECATHGVTTIRDAAGLPLLLNDVSQKIESLELLGPRIIACGPGINVRGGYPDYARPLPAPLARKYGDFILYVDGPDSARQAVRTAVEQGARFIKTFFDDRSLNFGRKPLNTMDDESVKALVDEAHRLGRRVAVHQSQLAGFRRALELGIDDLEHVPADGLLTEEDIKAFMAGSHFITPTAAVSPALGIAPYGHPSLSNPFVEAMQLEKERLLKEVYPAVCEEGIMRSNLKMTRIYQEGRAADKSAWSTFVDNELMLEAMVESRSNIGTLYEAGATICCGNDGGTPLNFPATLSVEMRLLEDLGLSRADILKAATINASRLIELEGELGSLETGKLADIVLLSADPLKDIRAVERVEAVFRSGVLLHRGRMFSLAGAGEK